MSVLEKRNLSIEKLEGGRRRNLGSGFFFHNRTYRRYYFPGHVTGDFTVCSCVDTRHCLMDKTLEIFVFAVAWTYVSQCLMDKSMKICFFAVTWTKDSVWWTSHRRFLSLQLLGHKAVFHGQITGNVSLNLIERKAVFDGQITGHLCLCNYLDKRQCLMDTLLEIYVFEVTWTKGSVWRTNHWRSLSLKLLWPKQCLMDKSMEICVFAVTWTKDNVDGQIIGDLCLWSYLDIRQCFDGQVRGDLCLCSCLDKRQCLMDKLLEIFVFEVTWT
jgi:hypothetical protein